MPLDSLLKNGAYGLLAKLPEQTQRSLRNTCRIRDCPKMMQRPMIVVVEFQGVMHTFGVCTEHLEMIQRLGTDLRVGNITRGIVDLLPQPAERTG